MPPPLPPQVQSRVLRIAGVILVTVLAFEHAARVNKWAHARPSVWLESAARVSRAGFEWLVARFVWLSSFLVHLHLDELLLSAGDLARALSMLVSSPLWFVYGYTHGAAEYMHPWIIWTGSALLVGALAYAARAQLARAGQWARENAGALLWLLTVAVGVYCVAWRVNPIEMLAPRLWAVLEQ